MTAAVIMVAVLVMAFVVPLLVGTARAREWQLFALFLVCMVVASMLIGASLERALS
ncbi:hypothetical protein [uncultured Microbacterium sp.]|uniref:hypothetical protein n=1 Tax=uncultured Microbacterium sp. TaxID=191216 RepID=UPI0025E2CBD0|nr:hypothetical protein [uncultured Microbacterium sp.]